MAVTATTKSKSLQIVTKATDAAGDEVKATKSFSDVNDAATNDQLYATAEAIHSLYSGDMDAVNIVTTTKLEKTA